MDNPTSENNLKNLEENVSIFVKYYKWLQDLK